MLGFFIEQKAQVYIYLTFIKPTTVTSGISFSGLLYIYFCYCYNKIGLIAAVSLIRQLIQKHNL